METLLISAEDTNQYHHNVIYNKVDIFLFPWFFFRGNLTTGREGRSSGREIEVSCCETPQQV